MDASESNHCGHVLNLVYLPFKIYYVDHTYIYIYIYVYVNIHVYIHMHILYM